MSFPRPTRVVLLNGSVGAGKTSTAVAVGERLERSGVSGAVVDLDALRRAWPSPPGDRFHLELALANLRDVSANARSAGLERLVLSGVVESREERARYAAAVGGELLQIRLKPSRGELSTQLHRRHRDDPEGLGWHLARAVELDRILDLAGADDQVIEPAGLGVDEVARQVMELAGWLDLTPDETSS